MSLLEPPRPALEPALEKQRVELADLIFRHAPQDGSFTTGVDALFVSRHSHPSDFAPSLPKPALCIMAQGRKEVRLADEYFAYDPLNYLVVSVSMPISGRVLEISPEHPVLALRLDIDPVEITTLISDAGPLGVPSRPTGRGLYVEPIDQPMLDAVLRLTRLLDTPKDIAMLAPLIRREILYRLLRSPQGYRLYEIASQNSQNHRVSRAISWLNGNFEQPLRIDSLAREANLSVSTLHHRFKAM
ncbi:MAG: AraC family transcriptional regulator, partial [Pseudomonas sp.]|nr:AraC family transcriptional regulator [Pseudomonas sp.]